MDKHKTRKRKARNAALRRAQNPEMYKELATERARNLYQQSLIYEVRDRLIMAENLCLLEQVPVIELRKILADRRISRDPEKTTYNTSPYEVCTQELSIHNLELDWLYRGADKIQVITYKGRYVRTADPRDDELMCRQLLSTSGYNQLIAEKE